MKSKQDQRTHKKLWEPAPGREGHQRGIHGSVECTEHCHSRVPFKEEAKVLCGLRSP